MKIKHLEELKTAQYFRDSELPCLVRIMHAAPSNTFVAFHGHEFSELVLVASGSIKHLNDKKSTDLHAGDFFIIHPGMRHGYAEMSPHAVIYNLLYTNRLREFVRLFPTTNLMRRIFPSDSLDREPEILGTLNSNQATRISRLMDEMRAEEKSPAPASPFCCGALFAAIVSILARGCPAPSNSSKSKRSIKPELDYLSEHFGEKITLESLSSVSGKSPSTLNRLFRAAVGKSPIDYLIDRRLDEAAVLSSTTNETLAAIAARCGFADASHLLRTRRQRIETLQHPITGDPLGTDPEPIHHSDRCKTGHA